METSPLFKEPAPATAEGFSARLEEHLAWLRKQIGKKYAHALTLMDGSTVNLIGKGVVLRYEGLSRPCDDANWYTHRRHYPWVEEPCPH